MSSEAPASSPPREWLACIACGQRYEIGVVRTTCGCGGLLEIARPAGWAGRIRAADFDRRASSRAAVDQSGVWRFREAVLDVPAAMIVTHPEGGTRLYERPSLSAWAGIETLSFKHEGENPTGSFKDRGMTVAMTQAVRLSVRAVACASTGNTSASLAAYAAQAGKPALVFIPAGNVALGKLAQTLAYGALCLQVRGDFDAAMRLVGEACDKLGIYLLNSINPFRIEGQKTIVWELLQDLGWDPPDWIALPAGNLGNTSAFGKALREAYEGGWIKRLPRLAAIQASGANPFFRSFQEHFATRHRVRAETIASAIRIGDPVSYEKARAAITATNGIVAEVTDAEILAAKREIDGAGIGCEPASACSLAGVAKLRREGVMKPSDRIVCILTGHVLKDPDIIIATASASGFATGVRPPIEIDPTLQAVEAAVQNWI